MYKYLSGPPELATEFLTANTIDADQIILDAGTVSAPSLVFSNDVDGNSGLYSTADNNVDVAVNGVRKFNFGDSLNTSQQALTIAYQNNAVQLGFLRADGNVSSTFLVADTLNLTNFNGIAGRTVNDTVFSNFSGGSNFMFRTFGNMNVHHINKGACNLNLYGTDGTDYRLDCRMSAPSNAVGGRMEVRGQTGTVDPALPDYSFINDNNTGLLWTGADAMSLVTGSVQRVLLNNTATTIANTLKYTGATPTSGYVMQSDADGNCLWADIETLGSLATVTGNYTGASTIAHETLRYSKSNGQVYIEYDEEKKVETSASGSLNLTALPAGYRPARAQTTTFLYNTVIPSGNDTIGRVEISTAGVVSFKADLAGGNFASDGSFLIRRWSFSYLTV